MNIRLLTMHSEEYKPLAVIVVPNMMEYCDRWNLDLAVEPMLPGATCWDFVRTWRNHLDKCDYLWWMGCDTLITNHNIDIHDFACFDLTFSADGNGLQSDVLLMCNNEKMRSFLDRVIAHESKGTNNNQDAMGIELSGEPSYASLCAKLGHLEQDGVPISERLTQKLWSHLSKTGVRINILPQRKFNAYPAWCYGGTGAEPWSWHPEDFVLHLPGKPLSIRLSEFPKIQITK